VVRAIFRKAFDRVGLPYSNPHSFRNTLVQLAYDLKLDPERFRAWSQNLGHESCLTTFSSVSPTKWRGRKRFHKTAVEGFVDHCCYAWNTSSINPGRPCPSPVASDAIGHSL
jgi:hypothetical protein